MDFHPGGVDELMKGVGKDATKLFENVRPFIFYPVLRTTAFISLSGKLFLCIRRSLIPGARLGELSQYSEKMRNRRIKPRHFFHLEYFFHNEKVSYGCEQFFVRDVRSKQKFRW